MEHNWSPGEPSPCIKMADCVRLVPPGQAGHKGPCSSKKPGVKKPRTKKPKTTTSLPPDEAGAGVVSPDHSDVPTAAPSLAGASPPPTQAVVPIPGMGAVTELLERFRLSQYADAFDDAGYDDLQYLLVLNADQINHLVSDVGMKPGHACKFRDYLLREQAGGA